MAALEQAEPGPPGDPGPGRLGHVDREHEAAARPDHPMDFGQQPVVGRRRPPARGIVVGLRIRDRQPRHGVVEVVVGNGPQPGAEIVLHELNAVARRRLQRLAQLAIGVLIRRGTVQPDNCPDGPCSPLPDGASDCPAAAPQIEPTLVGSRVGPVDRVFQQSMVR